MALSKVLEKMAKSHQSTADAPSLSSTNTATEQDTGAAGILLSLLTEPQQQKTQSHASTTTNINQAPVSLSPTISSDCGGSDSEKQNDPLLKGNDGSSTATAAVVYESRVNDKYSPRSVLLQLLQERKMNLGAGDMIGSQIEGCKREPVETQGPVGDIPKPIIITPGGEGRNDHNARNGDATVCDSAKNNACKSLDLRTMITVNSSTTVCQICQRGFWDKAKYAEHMEVEHSQFVKLTSTSDSTIGDGTPSSTPSPASTLETMPAKSASPVIVPDVDEGGLRRSKRKRTPARMKYVHEEVQADEDESEELQPKLLCVERNVMDKNPGQNSRGESDTWSMGSESGGRTSSEPGWKPSKKVIAAVSEAGKSTSQSSINSEGCADEKSGDRCNVIEEITSYRCSQCYLYFNSHEETRIHFRQEHNILTFHNPSAVPTTLPCVLAGNSKTPCSTCSLHANDGARKMQVRRCVVCGKNEAPEAKTFINIFRARTWSSRHHQLARRLSSALGCKLSFATCKSRTVCHGCVQKLENIEKASMQLRQMIRCMKRTQLVDSDQVKLKGIQRRMVKTANDSVIGGSSSLVKPCENSNSSKISNTISGGGGGGGGSGRDHMPSAPLVRELLAAPEVVLPQSQFSELIDALGSDKESAASSSINLTNRAVLHETPLVSSTCQRNVERRPGRQSRRLPIVQHDDTAFNDFISELRAQQPPPAARAARGARESIGRVDVRVKQEPGSEQSDTFSLQTEALGSLVPAYAANSAAEYTTEGLNVLEDLSSLYTKLQIDSHSGQTEYTCTLCSNSFYSEAAIQLHVKCHMPRSKDLQCFLCGYHNNLLPSQWRIMKRHLESEHDFPETYFHRFPCPVRGCAELFKCHRDMVVHVSKVHRTPARLAREHTLADTGLFNFPCHMCGTLLQSEAALQVHILCHNGSPKHYQCVYCGYMHTSQPGSWRIMRGHLSKEHVDKELESDIFSYHECPYYACRLKFCSKKAQIVHRACHDETKDGEFFCFHCHWSVPSTPYLWEKVRDHIIAKHPEAVGESFRCTCKMRFATMREFMIHMNQVNAIHRS